MSKSKLTPLEVVERYHKKYLEYETAFINDPYTEEDRQAKLKVIADAKMDTESEEYIDKMIDLVIDKPQKRADVNNSAFKFALFTDFYLMTNEEELPEKIMEDYNKLPIKESIKTYFSIKEGKFVKNEEKEVTDEMKNFFKAVIQDITSRQ